uniref:Uncharacterized protein n=1 Tax=Chromera velia CCMP2878 TaxID=1169474 RepID=A0A0G4FPA6_9ALVE|eukprot:Cvel_18031.t1-p1 / transcript=Cvel_18031.t1 / gene=Cvel_18031 / organism=Chromera_velia_CCMP2878 / gene_product=hypothetical protein / transcript_product=hypothetical protein / location=Cvel_scaffold1472:16660-17758(+) / protein_length=313 / sequence_SO=supercontig / SO=protein_coding / is_pseudo=false
MVSAWSISNLVAFILNAVLVNLSNTGIYGPTNAEQSAKYSTVITPAGYAFSIWGLIYITEGIWAIYQMFPPVSRSKLLSEGVSFWQISMSVFQVLWTIAFARDWIIASAVLLLMIWVSLVGLVVSLFRFRTGEVDKSGEKREISLLNYWIFCVPFGIHLGWVTAAAILNWNIVTVAQAGGPDGAQQQLSVAILSLALVFGASLIFTLGNRAVTEPAVPAVAIWAAAAISSQLQNPPQMVVEVFGFSGPLIFHSLQSVLLGLQYLLAAVFVFGIAKNVLGWTRGRMEAQQRAQPTDRSAALEYPHTADSLANKF